MKKYIVFLPYLISFILTVIIIPFQYQELYGRNYIINPIIISLIIIPLVFFSLSVFFDVKFYFKTISIVERKAIMAYLPLTISLYLPVTAFICFFNFLEGMYFIWLFVPVVLALIFLYFLRKFTDKNIKTQLIIKYCFSILLYFIGLAIYTIYNFV